MVNEAIENTRQLARGLHPVAAEPLGLMSALKKSASEVEALFHIRCIFECVKPLRVRDPNLATHLYRIAQEAVHNAIRHGAEIKSIITDISNSLGAIASSGVVQTQNPSTILLALSGVLA